MLCTGWGAALVVFFAALFAYIHEWLLGHIISNLNFLARPEREESSDGRPDRWKEILDDMEREIEEMQCQLAMDMARELYMERFTEKMIRRSLASLGVRRQLDDEDVYGYFNKGAENQKYTCELCTCYSGGEKHDDTKDMHFPGNPWRCILMVDKLRVRPVPQRPTPFEYRPRGKFLAELCDGPIPPATRSSPGRRRGKSAPPPAMAFPGAEMISQSV